MPRGALGLSELARHGFSELSVAKARLEQLGVPAELFSQAAHPDQALWLWERLVDTHPGAMAELARDHEASTRLAALLGASTGLGEFFLRQPVQLDVVTAAPEAPSSRSELISRLRAAVVGAADPTTALRIAYRRELARLALWDVTHPQPIEIVAQGRCQPGRSRRWGCRDSSRHCAR